MLPNLDLSRRRRGEDQGDNEMDLAVRGLNLACPDFAIVSSTDPRVQEIGRAFPNAAGLLNTFRDVRGDQIDPAVLIVKRNAPLRPNAGAETVVAFRNALALPVVLRARAAAAAGGGGMAPSWSDSFDFHPTQVNAQGRLVTISPALIAGFEEDAPHLATCSPHVARQGEHLFVDLLLYRHLSREWRRRYRPPFRRDPVSSRVFRSLEVAYQACSVATKNQGSLHEYGIQVALWVSALEILAWPLRHRASEDAVLDLLERFRWDMPELRAKRFVVHFRKGGAARRVNLVQRLCDAMYRARNAFLHGNPVSKGDLVPIRGRRALPLTSLSSIVYRTALLATLVGRRRDGPRDIAGQIIEAMSDRDYENALERVVGARLRSPRRR